MKEMLFRGCAGPKKMLQAPAKGQWTWAVALDLGSGTGYSTKILRGLGYLVTAVDPRKRPPVDPGDSRPWVDPGPVNVLTDEQFIDQNVRKETPSEYDTVNVNYGVDLSKVHEKLAGLVKRGGTLLAPVNNADGNEDTLWYARIHKPRTQTYTLFKEVGTDPSIRRLEVVKNAGSNWRWQKDVTAKE